MIQISEVTTYVNNAIKLAKDTNGVVRINKSKWIPCTFEERQDMELLMCSAKTLIFPKDAFATIMGTAKIRYLHSGANYGMWQEYLINYNKIVAVKGGSAWEINYLCTLEERAFDEKFYGDMIHERSMNARVPWRITKVTRGIRDDSVAISVLTSIKTVARYHNFTAQEIKELSHGIERRNNQIHKLIGDENWKLIKGVIENSQKLSRDIANYFIGRGEKI